MKKTITAALLTLGDIVVSVFGSPYQKGRLRQELTFGLISFSAFAVAGMLMQPNATGSLPPPHRAVPTRGRKRTP